MDEIFSTIVKYLNSWLLENNYQLNEAINEEMSFDLIGLDSLARVNMITHLEKEFSIQLDPTAAYDFVTVGALTKYVHSVMTHTKLNLKEVLEV